MRKENVLGGCRERMLRELRERRMFESTEQRECDKAGTIRIGGWLSELELEVMKRQVEDKVHGKLCRN